MARVRDGRAGGEANLPFCPGLVQGPSSVGGKRRPGGASRAARRSGPPFDLHPSWRPFHHPSLPLSPHPSAPGHPVSARSLLARSAAGPPTSIATSTSSPPSKCACTSHRSPSTHAPAASFPHSHPFPRYSVATPRPLLSVSFSLHVLRTASFQAFCRSRRSRRSRRSCPPPLFSLSRPLPFPSSSPVSPRPPLPLPPPAPFSAIGTRDRGPFMRRLGFSVDKEGTADRCT